ncbi:MAG: 5-deoxy-glucuronate isomerase, partial [Acidimicrobiaceae bacterium]
MSATSSWYFPNGSLSAPNQPLALDVKRAGWTYCGIDVYSFSAKNKEIEIDLGNREAVVVPLSSMSVTIKHCDKKYQLAGRPGVFAAVADWFYA